MNAGAELVIAWWLGTLGYADDFTKKFTNALYDGCSANEEDAISHRDSLLKQAMRADKGEMEAAIQAAYEFHLMKTQLAEDTAVFDAFQKLEKLLANEPQSKLAAKMMTSKLQSLLDDYRRSMKV